VLTVPSNWAREGFSCPSVSVGTTVLTITATSATMAYGGAVPAITATYGGFADGDSPASLTTAPTCSTSATLTSTVGTYASTCTGAADPNYASPSSQDRCRRTGDDNRSVGGTGSPCHFSQVVSLNVSLFACQLVCMKPG
jgi:MBG domain (YGX type)